MADAKLGPKMQEWQVEHSNLYLKSDGKEGHVMKRTPPGGYPEMDVYSLMLTTTGRKSGEKFVFPLYYGTTGDSYIIVASKGGAPDHPGWYKNLVANPDVEVEPRERSSVHAALDGITRAAVWSCSVPPVTTSPGSR